MASKILLISERPEDREFAKEVAGAAGLPLVIVAGPAEAEADLSLGEPRVVLADLSKDHQFTVFQSCLERWIGEGKGQIHPNFVHIIGTESMEKIRPLASTFLFGHFVVRNFGCPTEAGRLYGRIIQRLSVGSLGGMKNIIPPPANVAVVKLTHSADRARVNQGVEDYLTQQASTQPRMASIIVNAVDELLMNAIYDAPSTLGGEQSFKAVARNADIELSGRHEVELQMAHDDDYVAFTVIDRFGSLHKQSLLSHVFRSFSDREYEVNEFVAGAGLGLATTLKTGGSLLFLSEPGIRTEVTVLFKRARNLREFKEQFRFISIHVGSAGQI